ncbi:MAG: hypothetical protein ACREBJ_08655 [Nitrosotalea sp.]
MWVFNKVAFTSEKYDVPVYVEVRKGKSLDIFITLFIGAIITAAGAKAGNDIYDYVKKKVKEALKKKYKSTMSFDVNQVWKNRYLKHDDLDQDYTK